MVPNSHHSENADTTPTPTPHLGAYAAFARFQPPRHTTRAMKVKEKTNKCLLTRHCLVYCDCAWTVTPPASLGYCAPLPTPSAHSRKWNQLISRQELQAGPALDLCPSDWKKFLSLLRWPADIITAVCHFTLTSLRVTFQIAFPMKQQNSCCRDGGEREREKNPKRLFSGDKYPIK